MKAATRCVRGAQLAALVVAFTALPCPAQTAAPVAAVTPPATPAATAAPVAAAPRDYVLGAGDVVRISVYQNPDLSLEARISEGGSISYPLLGNVPLGGMTAQQAEETIANGLRQGQFVRTPQVSLLVLQVRGNQVSVLGFVNRPGRFPIDVNGMRLSELLALAGGIAVNGADVVTLSGTRDGQPLRQQIDVPSLLGGSGATADPVVQHGDVLFVDRMPMVYVYGEVQRPGALRLERGMTVMQGLAAAGGLNQRGTVRGLRVNRRGGDGKVVEIQPALDASLRDGDVVYVRESLF